MDLESDTDSESCDHRVLGGPRWLRIAKVGLVASLIGRIVARRQLPFPVSVQQVFSGGSMIVAFTIVRTAVIDIHHYLRERREERAMYSPVESQGSCNHYISTGDEGDEESIERLMDIAMDYQLNMRGILARHKDAQDKREWWRQVVNKYHLDIDQRMRQAEGRLALPDSCS